MDACAFLFFVTLFPFFCSICIARWCFGLEFLSEQQEYNSTTKESETSNV